MAIVNDGNSMALPSTVSGTYAGTTAALTVTCGFAPSWVIAWNVTDGDQVWLWTKNDAVNVVTIGTASTQTAAVVSTVDNGFVLPASSAVINENGKTYAFIAGR